MKLPVRIAKRYAQQKWLQRYLPSATLPAHQVDCPECGLRVSLPKLRQGQQADCPRCGGHLVRVEYNPYLLPLALALAGLIVMALVYSQMFATVRLGSAFAYLTLPQMVASLVGQDDGFLGTVLVVFTFGVPALFLLMCLYVYWSLLSQAPFPYLLYVARALTRLRHWLMADVFFISVLVADIKMSAVAQVKFGAAFWLMPVLALILLRLVQAVPAHWLYFQIRRSENHDLFQTAAHDQTVCCTRCLYFRPQDEAECGVCGSDVFDRRPHSLKLSFYFLLAATILYIPANLLPIMISENPLAKDVSTILGGILYMWGEGDKLIAVIIFSASIAVPSLKIISMALLLYSAKVKPLLSVERLSLQYRLTEAVGRWSMIDIFVIIILMSAFHTPVARVTPGPAAMYFCLVVLLTMWSAYFFDVRLIWDWKTRQHTDSAKRET
ncbi:paraquat-inducible protein A [Conchiformibius steedae]|uniref:paraquat-inducible protein A n=1 Tax=Conchiformibius steedae TaxID=153493 RepID=UPI0026EC9AE2|nr:paraquat-inducible protein A [Conchiformibius steedae]